MAEQTLYIECYSGVSGDMTVAALLDLGADKEVLLKGLKSLNVKGYSIEIKRILKNGIDACDFDVILDESIFKNHDNASDINRNIYDIYKIIDNSSITENAKNISKKIFKIKAVAESKAHDVEIEHVYFHEAGAVDSIVDIVSAAICLDNLEINDVIVSQIYDGCGFIKCRKGLLPVPVPAVINIANEHDLNIKNTDNVGEMVTPTGAAIMAAIITKKTLPDNYKIKKTGIGAGKREYSNDGVLRMYII